MITAEINVFVEEGHDGKNDGDHKDESSKEEKLYRLNALLCKHTHTHIQHYVHKSNSTVTYPALKEAGFCNDNYNEIPK